MQNFWVPLNSRHETNQLIHNAFLWSIRYDSINLRTTKVYEYQKALHDVALTLGDQGSSAIARRYLGDISAISIIAMSAPTTLTFIIASRCSVTLCHNVFLRDKSAKSKPQPLRPKSHSLQRQYAASAPAKTAPRLNTNSSQYRSTSAPNTLRIAKARNSAASTSAVVT